MTPVMADIYVFTVNIKHLRNSSYYYKIYTVSLFDLFVFVFIRYLFHFDASSLSLRKDLFWVFWPWMRKIDVGCVWLYCVVFCAHAIHQYLGLRQAQFGCQVSPLGQGEVLGLLEALVERLELQAGVNGPRLPDLLPLPVQPHLPVLYHRRGLLVFWREESRILQRWLSTLGISEGTEVWPYRQRHHSTKYYKVSCSVSSPTKKTLKPFKMLWKIEILTRKPLQNVRSM